MKNLSREIRNSKVGDLDMKDIYYHNRDHYFGGIFWGNTQKGETNGCIVPIGHSVLLPWLQTSFFFCLFVFFEKPEIVFNSGKEFLSLCCGRKKTTSLCFKHFLRNRFLSNARWFYFKNPILGTEMHIWFSKKCRFS